MFYTNVIWNLTDDSSFLIFWTRNEIQTVGGSVVVFAEAFLPGHTHSILQDPVTLTTTGAGAEGRVQTLCVTMEI